MTQRWRKLFQTITILFSFVHGSTFSVITKQNGRKRNALPRKMDVVHWVFQLECRGWKIATNALFLFQERGRMEISCQLRLRRIDFCPFFCCKISCFFFILKCILWNHKPQDQFLMKGFYLGVFDWLDGRSLCNEPPCWVITEIWSCIFFLSAFYSTLSTQRLKTTPGWAKMRNLLSKHQSET